MQTSELVSQSMSTIRRFLSSMRSITRLMTSEVVEFCWAAVAGHPVSAADVVWLSKPDGALPSGTGWSASECPDREVHPGSPRIPVDWHSEGPRSVTSYYLCTSLIAITSKNTKPTKESNKYKSWDITYKWTKISQEQKAAPSPSPSVAYTFNQWNQSNMF